MKDAMFLAANVEGKLNLRWSRKPDDIFLMPERELPSSWNFDKLSSVAFGDFDKDGKGPDVLTITEHMTGIGPDGARPFPVASLYSLTEDFQYRVDENLNKKLEDSQAGTISQAEEALAN